MKKKKIGIAVLAILIVSMVGFGIYYYIFHVDNSTTLSIKEKRWIENNKNKRFSLSIATEVPVFSYNGEGIFFDYIDYTEKDINLEFDKVPESSSKDEYSFGLKDQVEENDILIYEDTYALIQKEQKTYHSVADMKGLMIGVITSDLEKVNEYIKRTDVEVKTFETIDQLWEEFEKEDSSIKGVVLPKLLCLRKELEKSYSINYILEGFTKKYVLTLGNEEVLNSILKKQYKKWSSSFEDSFSRHFSDEYFTFAKVGEKEKANFSRKQYQYGFIKNMPYDTLSGSRLVGINSNILKSFSEVSDVEISFHEYRTMEELVKAFKEDKIDFMYQNNSDTEYQKEVISTIPYLGEELVILSDISNPISATTIASFDNYELAVLKETKLSSYLSQNGVHLKEYNTMKDLLNHKNSKTLIALDSNSYEYYVRDELNHYIPVYRMIFQDGNGFVIRASEGNDVFAKFLNFYLSFMSEKQFVSSTYQKLISGKQTASVLWLLLLVVLSFVLLLFVLFSLYKYIHSEKKQAKLTRGDRIRYIDQLTSLKNRNYLNDNVEKWDNSEIYPQSIIIVDLNNIAYINDNYGHQEGDTVIKEAANILIKSQIENTEIIRTNGNEFLIYLVGYDEKQIVAYTKKLNKELKEIAHGFGAAIGYSMITDAIKTIDDAVNEATLDMREQKEEINHAKED